MVAYRIPESFKAFCKIVSLTAAKTSRMLVVSVAWVRLKVKEEAMISDRYCKNRKQRKVARSWETHKGGGSRQEDRREVASAAREGDTGLWRNR